MREDLTRFLMKIATLPEEYRHRRSEEKAPKAEAVITGKNLLRSIVTQKDLLQEKLKDLTVRIREEALRLPLKGNREEKIPGQGELNAHNA